MVKAQELIGVFQTMWKERWKYTWSAAEKGNVDCSGAFVYAFKQFGISYPHGSNAIARQYTFVNNKTYKEDLHHGQTYTRTDC